MSKPYNIERSGDRWAIHSAQGGGVFGQVIPDGSLFRAMVNLGPWNTPGFESVEAAADWIYFECFGKAPDEEARPVSSEKTDRQPHPSNEPRGNLAALFTYRPPKGARDLLRHEEIRNAGRELADVILRNCPPCADTNAAIRKVREAVMTANAAIALEPES